LIIPDTHIALVQVCAWSVITDKIVMPV